MLPPGDVFNSVCSDSKMMGAGGQPIIVLSQGTKRESGHHVQIGNITACKVNCFGIEFNIRAEI